MKYNELLNKLNILREVLDNPEAGQSYYHSKLNAANIIYQVILSFDIKELNHFISTIKKSNANLLNLLIIGLVTFDPADKSQKSSIQSRIGYLDFTLNKFLKIRTYKWKYNVLDAQLYYNIGIVLDLAVESNCLELVKFLVETKKIELLTVALHAVSHAEYFWSNPYSNLTIGNQERDEALEIVKYIIETLDFFQVEEELFTILNSLITSKIPEIVQLITEELSEYIDSGSKEIYTVLHTAIQRGEFQVVKTLISLGVKINIRTNLHYTPLHHAILYGQRNLVDLLIEKGAEINIQDPKGFTPLHYAAINGDGYIISVLQSHNAITDATSEFGTTPLHCAALHGKEQAIIILQANMNNINQQNKYGFTPLHYAASKGYVDSVKTLLKLGADPGIKGSDGSDPLQLMSGSRLKKLMSQLVKDDDILYLNSNIFACEEFVKAVLKYAVNNPLVDFRKQKEYLVLINENYRPLLKSYSLIWRKVQSELKQVEQKLSKIEQELSSSLSNNNNNNVTLIRPDATPGIASRDLVRNFP